MVLYDVDKPLICENPNAAILPRVLVCNFESVIGAAVVDDNIFVVLINLTKNALNAVRQVCSSVINRSQYSDEGLPISAHSLLHKLMID